MTYQSAAANLSKLLLGYLITAQVLLRTGNTEKGQQLLEDLHGLPEVTAQVIRTTEARGQSLAKAHAHSPGFYVMGTGILAGLAYQFQTCTLLEMQWLHASMINAAELAHGPLEIVQHDTPVIALIGNDESRDIAARADEFTRTYSQHVLSFDVQDIAPDLNPLLAPFAVHIALQWFVWYLSLERNHPITTRRYMGKVKI